MRTGMITVIALALILNFSETAARALRTNSKSLIATEDVVDNILKPGDFIPKLIHREYMCTQLDLLLMGGIVGISFSAAVEVEIKAPQVLQAGEFPTLTLSGLIGGGVSVNVILVAGSLYLEGKMSMTSVIPRHLYELWNKNHNPTSLVRIVGHALKSLFQKNAKEWPLTRFLKKYIRFQRPTMMKKFTNAKEILQNLPDDKKFHQADWTPWACRLRWRGDTGAGMPNVLPHDTTHAETCAYKSQKLHNLGPNWLICPSKMNDWRVCTYFCPSLARNIFAYSNKQGEVFNALALGAELSLTNRNGLPPCPNSHEEMTNPLEKTPVQCEKLMKLVEEKHGEIDGEMPFLLPDDKACRGVSENPNHGWIACPTSPNKNWGRCDYFCPSRNTVLNSRVQGTNHIDPHIPTYMDPSLESYKSEYACSTSPSSPAEEPTKLQASKQHYCARTLDAKNCGWTETNFDTIADRTIARRIRLDGIHQMGELLAEFKRRKRHILDNIIVLPTVESQRSFFKGETFGPFAITEAQKQLELLIAEIKNIFETVYKKKVKNYSTCAADDDEHPINSLMCLFVAHGMMLENFEDGRSTATEGKVEEMMPFLFPELIVKRDDGAGLDTTKSELGLQMLWNAEKISTIDDGNDCDSCPLAFDMLKGVTYFLSLPAVDMEARMKILLEKSDAEEEEACKVYEMEGSITIGATVGGSIVGFCTPDTNPFQLKATAEHKWTGKYNKQAHKCEIKKEKAVLSRTFTAAFSLYLQFYRTEVFSKSGKDVDIGVSIRWPCTTQPGPKGSDFLTPKDTPAAIHWLGDIENAIKQADFTLSLGTVDTFLKDKLGPLIEHVNSLAHLNHAESPFFQSMETGLFEGLATKGFEAVLGSVASKIFQGLLASQEQLIGIDIKKRRGVRGFEFSIVHHSFKVFKISFPDPNSGTIFTISGSVGQEQILKLGETEISKYNAMQKIIEDELDKKKHEETEANRDKLVRHFKNLLFKNRKRDQTEADAQDRAFAAQAAEKHAQKKAIEEEVKEAEKRAAEQKKAREEEVKQAEERAAQKRRDEKAEEEKLYRLYTRPDGSHAPRSHHPRLPITPKFGRRQPKPTS